MENNYMISERKHAYFSIQEYLDLEKISPIKHEYIQGEVYAMVGVSDPHNTIAINLLTLLRIHVRGTRSRIFIADMKARIEAANAFYYPDIMVTCDERDRNSKYFKSFPSLIVEVLSPTTENFDRGDKFQDYQQIPTLMEYLLLSQDKIQVECFRRDSQNNWQIQTYKKGDILNLISVDFNCKIEELYEDVEEINL